MLDQQPLQPTPPPATPPTAPADAKALDGLHALLARARLRQRSIWLLTSLLVAAGAVLVLVPGVLGLAAAGVHAARWLFWGVFAAAAAGVAWFGVVRARRELKDDLSTAHLLAERLPPGALRAGLLPAAELARALKARPGAGDGAFSHALAGAHIARVAAEAPRADLSRAIPDRPVRLAAAGLGAALLVLLGAIFVFGSALGRGVKFLLLPATGASQSAQALAEPVTGEIELTYVYPAHTRLATRTVPNTNGEVVAPRGTQVTLKTRADRDLAKAVAVVNGATVQLATSGRDLAGAFVVDKPGSYHFVFFDAREGKLAEGPPIPIAVEADAPPKASIVSPVTDVEVDPKDRLTVRYEADDDFGLSELALVFKLPGATKEQRVALGKNPEAPRRASGDYVWEVVSLGLMPGDRVAYYLEATDNDDVSGRKKGVSKTQYLTVYSEAEHHRQIVKKVEEKWEQLVTLLADRMEGPDREATRGTPEQLKAGTAVDQRAVQLADELNALGRALKKEKAPDQLRRALFNVALGLDEKARATTQARNVALSFAGRAGAENLARRLENAVRAEIGEEEKDVLYLEALLDNQRIKDLVQLARELSAKRRDLATLMEQFQKAPDEATRERIQNEIGRLKERMAELLKRMQELSKSINDQHVNEEALQEMEKTADMMDAFDEIQKLMNEGKVDEAMKKLEELGQQMDELEKNLQKAGGEQQGGEFSELGKELSQFKQDLDNLQDQQEDLLKQTQDVRNNYKQALKDRLDKKGKEFVPKLREKVKQARDKLKQVSDESMRQVFRLEDSVRAAEEELDSLDQALAVQDFDEAQQQAAKALEHARQAAESVDRQVGDLKRMNALPPSDPAGLEKSNKAANEALPQIRDVKEELDKLFPSPSEMMTSEDRQKMQQQSQKQQQLQQQAQKLGQKMQELGQKAPIFSPDAQQLMQGAGQRMGRAQGQLGARNPTGAMAEQRSALDQIGQLQKGLEQQSQQQGGGGGQSIPWPWMGQQQGEGDGQDEGMSGQNNDQKVVIPGADQHQIPDEYRKDILDAMKQGTPEKYKDQVKKYYEEIVK